MTTSKFKVKVRFVLDIDVEVDAEDMEEAELLAKPQAKLAAHGLRARGSITLNDPVFDKVISNREVL